MSCDLRLNNKGQLQCIVFVEDDREDILGMYQYFKNEWLPIVENEIPSKGGLYMEFNKFYSNIIDNVSATF